MILIRNGRVIGPAEGLDIKADVVLDGGRIAKIIPAAGQGKDGRIGDTGDGGENGPDGARADDMGADSADMHGADTYGADTDSAVAGSGPYAQIIDAEGMIVAPGLVDVHVHFRDPGLTYKEDIRTGAKAAAKGGFTTVVCMANTKPIVDNKETLSYVLEEGKKTGIHVLSCAAVSMGFKGQELTDMEGLLAAGAAGFTDDGIPLMDGAFVRAAMEEAARLDTVLSFHEEDKAFIKENGINHGKVSDKLGIYGSPALAEDSLVARDCMIALDTGATVDIQHISSGHSVEMVRLAKKLGAKVWAEVTPHHFTLTEDAVHIHGTLAKMNPPLRTEQDRQMLIEGLKDGTIDMIATDHALTAKRRRSVR